MTGQCITECLEMLHDRLYEIDLFSSKHAAAKAIVSTAADVIPVNAKAKIPERFKHAPKFIQEMQVKLAKSNVNASASKAAGS